MPHSRLWLLALASLAISSPALARPAIAGELTPGQIIVHGEVARALHALRGAALGATALRPIGGGAWVVELEQRSEVATWAALAALDRAQLPAEPSLIRRPCRVPSDPYYPLQWGAKAIKLEQAWDKSTGSAEVVIGFVDTGVLADHPDLQGRLLPGRDFITDPASAGDGDGWDADAKDEGSDLISSSGLHGTHIAGILGAATDNGVGVAGVSWSSRLLPVRALGVKSGTGADADIAVAIRWAAGAEAPGVPANPTPARVVLLGFGGPGYNAALAEAVKAALARGAIVIAAAGNQAADATSIYPAAFPGVIAVGATDYDGKRAAYSNFGKTVAIMAPGGSLTQNLPFQFQGKTHPAAIISTLYDSKGLTWGYHFYEGTTMAAAYVAGVVALLLARRPTLTAAEVASVLESTAVASAKCAEGCGAGLVDAAAALAKLDPPGANDGATDGPTCSGGDCTANPTPRGCTCSLEPAPSGGYFLLALCAGLLGAVRRVRGPGGRVRRGSAR